jgi:hypothetical protein
MIGIRMGILRDRFVSGQRDELKSGNMAELRLPLSKDRGLAFPARFDEQSSADRTRVDSIDET